MLTKMNSFYKTFYSYGRLQLQRKMSVKIDNFIDIKPSVLSSIRNGEPVVALESTIITHGMPHPQNLETACEVEQVVRRNGAVPATVAIIDGRIKVGLSTTELFGLSVKCQNEVIKCSRRDLPFVISARKSGGTTVAATMIIAKMVGIKIFATGGIGGVHREGHITMDVSADLIELGRTPVAVVCSGIKSILDIPRTLEYLETQGVCVATYGSANDNFPDFYTRDSGYKAPYILTNATEAAQLIESVHALKLNSGILIGVPIPEEHEINKKLVSSAIKMALTEAKKRGISGKAVTPFLLDAIAKITKGNSLEANMALIKHNAFVAAKIAVELSGKRCTSVEPAKKVQPPLIIGACILDLSLTMFDEMPTIMNGATYHIHAKQSAGGVGRNLAEGILKLYGKANLISVVGNDQLGKNLLNLIPEPLQKGVQINDENSTSLCSIIFDKTGDCKLILGNMDIHNSITPKTVDENKSLLESAPLVVIDSNISMITMEHILNLAVQYKRPVFFEPTDMRIAGKPFALPTSLTTQIKMISPNFHELKTIVEVITKKSIDYMPNLNDNTEHVLQKAKQMMSPIADIFDCIILTLGHHGVLLSLCGVPEKPWFNPKTNAYTKPAGAHSFRFYKAPTVKEITNVSGAGDSFCSGFITGMLRGYNIDQSVALGFMAAERALRSDAAVPNDYFIGNETETKLMEETLKCLKMTDL